RLIGGAEKPLPLQVQNPLLHLPLAQLLALLLQRGSLRRELLRRVLARAHHPAEILDQSLRKLPHVHPPLLLPIARKVIWSFGDGLRGHLPLKEPYSILPRITQRFNDPITRTPEHLRRRNPRPAHERRFHQPPARHVQ